MTRPFQYDNFVQSQIAMGSTNQPTYGNQVNFNFISASKSSPSLDFKWKSK